MEGQPWATNVPSEYMHHTEYEADMKRQRSARRGPRPTRSRRPASDRLIVAMAQDEFHGFCPQLIDEAFLKPVAQLLGELARSRKLARADRKRVRRFIKEHQLKRLAR